LCSNSGFDGKRPKSLLQAKWNRRRDTLGEGTGHASHPLIIIIITIIIIIIIIITIINDYAPARR
jgi:hypothetical protein